MEQHQAEPDRLSSAGAAKFINGKPIHIDWIGNLAIVRRFGQDIGLVGSDAGDLYQINLEYRGARLVQRGLTFGQLLSVPEAWAEMVEKRAAR